MLIATFTPSMPRACSCDARIQSSPLAPKPLAVREEPKTHFAIAIAPSGPVASWRLAAAGIPADCE